MDARELIREGRLEEAIAAQSAATKARPDDQSGRFLLFVLLAYAGELDRAGRQLDAIAVLDPPSVPALLVYRQLVASELARRAFWEGGADPLLPPEGSAAADRRLEALRALRQGQAEAARLGLDEAARLDGESAVSLDGQDLAMVRDEDERLGATLEVFAGGQYLWFPLSLLRRVEVSPPRRLVDLLWTHAHLEDSRGVEADVFLPVLYEDSWRSKDDRVRLGWDTSWEDRAGVTFRGRGRHVLQYRRRGSTEVEAVGVPGIRSLSMVVAPTVTTPGS